MKSSFEIIGYCTFALSILWLLGFASPSRAAAARGMEMMDSSCGKQDCTCTRDLNSCQKENCCTCTRDLTRVLQGGATTLAALVVSLGRWYLTDFHLHKRRIIGCFPEVAVLRIFWTFVGGVLLPQIFMSFVLSSALCATVLQQRVSKEQNKEESKEQKKEKSRMAKRLSAMVVWIPVDKKIGDMNTFFEKHKSLRDFCTEHELPPVNGTDQNKLKKLPQAPDVEDALVLYDINGKMKQVITEHNNSGKMKKPDTEDNNNSGSGGGCCSSNCQKKKKQHVTQQNNNSGSGYGCSCCTSSKVELQPVTEHNNNSGNASGAGGNRTNYILCSQDWDAKNRLWKEAMLNIDGVLPGMEELETIESRTKLECVGVAIQALGYLTGIVSRFAAGGNKAAISPVEIMSAWISILLLVQVVIIPQLVTFCNKGMCLHLPAKKFDELVKYYELNKEQQSEIDLTSKTIWLFVLCIFFQFALFLILIPALVYEYYRLPDTALAFTSLILFSILSGVAIIAFVFTLIFPAQEVLFAFSAFPGLRPDRPATAAARPTDYMPVISSILLLLGFSAYVLAIADTVLNWHRFKARDCYFSNFVIPHVGS